MVKAPLEAELTSLLKGNRRGDVAVEYLNSYDDNGHFERMRASGDAADLPDVTAYLGFGVPFSRAFRGRFMEDGLFEGLAFPSLNEKLAGEGFLDPENRYTVLAINPMVIVVDQTRLDGRKVPSTWADILEPEYERSVALVGRSTSFNETVVLSIHRHFGMEGVKKLGRAIAWAGHPAEMVRKAGRGLPEAAAINILDYFFARQIRRQDRITIVWPQEGALAIPFVTLAKGDRTGRLSGLAEFLTGPVFARICADAYFYPASGEVSPRLASSARLDWPGWEYLWKADTEALMEEIRPVLLDCLMEGSR